MLYSHPELNQLPLDILEEERKIQFSVDRLSPMQREAFEKIQNNVLSKKNGEPYDVAQTIFKEY